MAKRKSTTYVMLKWCCKKDCVLSTPKKDFFLPLSPLHPWLALLIYDKDGVGGFREEKSLLHARVGRLGKLFYVRKCACSLLEKKRREGETSSPCRIGSIKFSNRQKIRLPCFPGKMARSKYFKNSLLTILGRTGGAQTKKSIIKARGKKQYFVSQEMHLSQQHLLQRRP